MFPTQFVVSSEMKERLRKYYMEHEKPVGPVQGTYTCLSCFSQVATKYKKDHNKWHRILNRNIKAATQGYNAAREP